MRRVFLKDYNEGGRKLGMVRRWQERERETETERGRETERQGDRDRHRERERERETERENIPSSFQCYPVGQTQPKARGQLVGVVCTTQTLATSFPNPHTAIKPLHKQA